MAVVRTNVIISEKYKLANRGELNQLAEEIVRFNTANILNFYRAQRQLYDSGVTQYQRTQREMIGLSMNMSIVQKQEIITLNVYPENFAEARPEGGKYLMVVYGENSVAAIPMSALASPATMTAAFKRTLKLVDYEGNPIRLTPPDGLVYYGATQKKFDLAVGGMALSSMFFSNGKLSIDYYYDPRYPWYLSPPVSSAVNAYNYSGPYSFLFEAENFEYSQARQDEWFNGNISESVWIFNWGQGKFYFAGGIYSFSEGTEQGGKYVIKYDGPGHFSDPDGDVRCISSNGTYYTGPAFYRPDYAVGQISFATGNPDQDPMTVYQTFNPNPFGFNDGDLYSQGGQLIIDLENTYTQYNADLGNGVFGTKFANGGYLGVGTATSEEKTADLSPLCNLIWTDGFGVNQMELIIPSATVSVPHAVLNQVGGVDSIEIQFSDAEISTQVISVPFAFTLGQEITLTYSGYTAAYSADDPIAIIDTSSRMLNKPSGVYKLYRSYNAADPFPAPVSVKVGTPYEDYPDYTGTDDDGKGIGAPWLDLSNGEHHIQSFIPHYQNAGGDPYIKIYCNGQDITSRLEAILGVQAKYIHGMLMDVPLTLILDNSTDS